VQVAAVVFYSAAARQGFRSPPPQTNARRRERAGLQAVTDDLLVLQFCVDRLKEQRPRRSKKVEEDKSQDSHLPASQPPPKQLRRRDKKLKTALQDKSVGVKEEEAVCLEEGGSLDDNKDVLPQDSSLQAPRLDPLSHLDLRISQHLLSLKEAEGNDREVARIMPALQSLLGKVSHPLSPSKRAAPQNEKLRPPYVTCAAADLYPVDAKLASSLSPKKRALFLLDLFSNVFLNLAFQIARVAPGDSALSAD